jgi:hypothetical protein
MAGTWEKTILRWSILHPIAPIAFSIEKTMKQHVINSLFIGMLLLLASCAGQTDNVWDSNCESRTHGEEKIKKAVNHILTQLASHTGSSTLSITYPYHQSVFPPDIAAPVFTWEDRNGKSKRWLLVIGFRNGQKPIYVLLNQTRWMPENSLWKTIKANSVATPVDLSVAGISDIDTPTVTAKDTIEISTAADPVAAAVFFRQVPLPFSTKNFDQMKWCLGDISSNGKPRVVMENMPICASCHVFSKDGTTISMEMNYHNDGGAQFVAPVEKNILLTDNNFISWNDYPRGGILPKSRGLFGKMSPFADYIVSSVNEISLALITNDFPFSQVFFPTYGILAFYSAKERKFRPLPGADDFSFVHANPNWSPDQKVIVFCRSKTKNEVHEDISHVVPLFKDEGIHALNKQFNIQFDLYRIEFNNGKGGVPEPIEGASRNGFSNYFPRYSPDGKWIVYTRSKTGIMLQPDSQLFIVPSQGGVARIMNCNRALFNSWHSWSPNGKWLLFSSKVNTPYTEIFLTHIDENGNDSPPVVLSQFSSTTYAANVPEFANIAPDAIETIRVRGYNN